MDNRNMDPSEDNVRKTKEETYDFDELLTKKVGEFGRKQCFLSMLLTSSATCTCLQSLSSVFIAGVPEHWCKTTDDVFSNCTEDQVKALTIPIEYRDGQSVYSQCQIFKYNYTEQEIDGYCSGNSSSPKDMYPLASVGCSQWDFDTSVYSHNIVTEWGMVCSQAGYASTVAAVYMVGRIVGCLFAGQLGDKFGRRRPMLVTSLLFVIVSFASCAMPNYLTFILTRLLMSVLGTVRDNTGILLAVELVGPSWRVFVTVAWLIFWSVGYIILAALAYVITGWRYLQAILTVLDLLLFAAFIIFVPESPRWLLVHNKQDEAMKIIRDITKGNGKRLPKNIMAQAQEEKSTATYLDLLKTPAIRFIAIVLFYNWFSNAFVYYGLSLNTASLGGNPYINFLLSGAVEFPAYLYIWWSFAKFGRIKPFGLIFILAAISLLAIMAVPQDTNWLVVTFAMIGKFAISASFGMAWLYTMEAYPTSIRSLGLNMSSTFARLASVPASYVGMLSDISRELPLLIFGAMALIGGALVFILPETRDQPMRQTIREGEEFVRQNICKIGPCNRPKSISMDEEVEMQKMSTLNT